MDKLLINSWDSVLRVIISAVIVYVAVVIFVRVSGKRSTSQMNNFDWIVTVMVGSIGASTIILKSTPLTEGLLSILTLLTLQYLVTKTSVYSDKFRNLVYANPKIVVYRGEFLIDAMHEARVTKQEIYCALREASVHCLDDVQAVILESDAKLGVLTYGETVPSATLSVLDDYATINDPQAHSNQR